MKIKSLVYDEENKRHIIEFEHGEIMWFRFLPERILRDEDKFMVWLNSLIDDVKLRH